MDDRPFPNLDDLSLAFDAVEAALLSRSPHRHVEEARPCGAVTAPALLSEVSDLRLKVFGYVVRADLLRAKAGSR